jgi:hypothetical protein
MRNRENWKDDRPVHKKMKHNRAVKKVAKQEYEGMMAIVDIDESPDVYIWIDPFKK